MSLPNSPWPGIIKLFLARESLVNDIPARDGINDDLFYSVPTFITALKEDGRNPILLR
jgi:hypothetical protein